MGYAQFDPDAAPDYKPPSAALEAVGETAVPPGGSPLHNLKLPAQRGPRYRLVSILYVPRSLVHFIP